MRQLVTIDLLVSLCRPWPCLHHLPRSCDPAALASGLVSVLLHDDHSVRSRRSGQLNPLLCFFKNEMQTWMLFFLISTLICRCVFLQFVGLESIMTSLTDIYPSQIRKGYRRELCLMLICSCSFMLGLFLVSEVSFKKCIYCFRMRSAHVPPKGFWQQAVRRMKNVTSHFYR